jgi:hypothetical protein
MPKESDMRKSLKGINNLIQMEVIHDNNLKVEELLQF